MFVLISAEIARIQKQYDKAANLCKEALELSRTNGFIFSEAIACECAGKSYLEQEMSKEASHYINKAYRCYQAWGASTKLVNMTEEYPQSISVKQETAEKKSTADDPIMEKPLSDIFSLANLDLQTISEAADLLAVDHDAQQILKNLLNILAKKSGAERVLLFLEKTGILYLGFECLADNKKISETHPSALKKDYPESIIRFVMRVKEMVILANVKQENRFLDDKYISKTKPKSLVCIPVIWKSKFFGVLYMENKNSNGVFTLNRLEVLKSIVNQIAMLIEISLLKEKDLSAPEKTQTDPNSTLMEILKKDYKLTNQESNIAILFKEGFSRKQIRDQLNITDNTLRGHLKMIYEKTINPENEDLKKIGRIDKISMLILFLDKLE